MRETADPDNERAELVGRLTGAVHPHDRAHEYLLMIGVSPERQGEGIGEALMRGVLERCDREGIPAYLEASSERSRGLYERLGFTFMGRTVDLPEGPPMWPMWREPRSRDWPGPGRRGARKGRGPRGGRRGTDYSPCS